MRWMPPGTRAHRSSPSCPPSPTVIIIALRHAPAAQRHSIGEVERHASAAGQHVRLGRLGDPLSEQQHGRLPRRIHVRQDGDQFVPCCGSWGRRHVSGRLGCPVPGPPEGLSESAYRERVLAGGHLDLDSKHARGRAVLPDTVRGGIVFGSGSRHTDYVSGNAGGRQRFRKRDISSPGKRLSAVV